MELPPLKIVDSAIHVEGDRSFSRQPAGRGLAIIFNDAFGHYWVPFLGYQFAEVDYFWQTSINPKIIEQMRPNVVVHEMVERSVDTDDPGKLSAKDALPESGD